MRYPRPFIEVFPALEGGWMYSLVILDHNDDEIEILGSNKTFNTAGQAACYAESDWEDWKKANGIERESV